MVQQLISARTLATIHGLQERLMPDRAVILTPAGVVNDGAGGTLPGSATESSPIPCRAAPRLAQASEGLQGPQLVTVNAWTVTLLGAQTVTPDQQIAVTFYAADGVTVRGVTLFEVVGPTDPRSFGTETSVECKVVSSSGVQS